ncbi:DEAD/DEAH box helicase [Sediminispirochaeta bajacaliforniensis]|uniref:DEAD/DEAH box helicase n=1 Tax=Sediminispirochaeta bajacaliforniensis TaxID=148 RepID=UPI0003788405|nr:DEAD/DEAH box helicase [Sediminispirochaeta bajacaliforniensis]
MASQKSIHDEYPFSDMIFTSKHLVAAKHLFEPIIRHRGAEYFREGRVAFESLSPEGAFFSVEGSRGMPYSVVLRTKGDKGDDLSASSCNCPYDDFCKHIWASLLTAINDKLPLPSGLGISKSFSRASGESWVRDLIKEPQHPVRDPKKRFRLLFLIGPYPSYAFRSKLFVRPALRYIRQDGELGAISNFRDSAHLADVSDREKMLLSSCLEYEGNRLDLHTGIGYLLGEKGIPAYVDNGQTPPVPITIFPVEGLEVDFRPQLEENGEVEFQPLLAYIDSQGRRQHVAARECLLDRRGAEKFLFHPLSGLLALVPVDNGTENRALDLLVNGLLPWRPENIRELERLLPKEQISLAEVKTEFRFSDNIPRLTLDITEVPQGLEFSVGIDHASLPDSEVSLHADGYWVIPRVDYQAALKQVSRSMGASEGFSPDASLFRVNMTLVQFLKEKAHELLAAGLLLRLNSIPIHPAGEIRIESASGVDWLDLRVSIDGQDIGTHSLDLSRRLLSAEDHFIVLDDDQVDRLIHLNELDRGKSGSFRLYPNDIATVQDLGSLIDGIDDPRLERSRNIIARLETGFDTRQEPPSPLLRAKLREYQKTGLEWLRFLERYNLGGILADDMGLGKTIQTIALLADTLRRGDSGPYLIVAPVSVVPNWASEFHRFLPEMEVTIHIGTDRAPLGKAPRGVVLTSYQILRLDAGEFTSISWHLLCLDESQNIKNAATKTYKTVRTLSADRALALSGTPIENSVMELWAVMDIVNPGLLGTREAFKRHYAKAVNAGNGEITSNLRKRIAPFILRRTKGIVASELPAREEVLYKVELSSQEARFYTRLKESMRAEVKSLIDAKPGSLKVANAILMALLRLRQAAISPILLDEKPETSSKLDVVIQLLETLLAEGHKVLIFSQFVKVLSLLRARLEAKEMEYAYLDGSLGTRAREQAIRSFKNAKGIFLISLKAGGTGLNLTEADYVFILDPWWNPAVESQAIDRSHRIGQRRPVIAYKFISAGTVEERIIELQEHKRRVANELLSFDSSLIGKMNREEILALFR